ncbi:hypothetical protein BDV29DRAFT_196420 [Aspergillus leporis]|uniref:Uncharacterized protein n=1 Tax=Aspergillus leporis TaxID=41062 RepID=A0A5N5WK82_9EURO|nr:hypothetical protein BDV29DRAFT_196420 [Aspergillus leporis]
MLQPAPLTSWMEPCDSKSDTSLTLFRVSLSKADTVSFRKLDLTDLPAVHEVATTIAADIKAGKLPPQGTSELTTDGYGMSFQVNHIAHAALVLRLIGHFDPKSGGRIVLFSSDAHWSTKNDLETLVKPPSQTLAHPLGRGFQHYANSKLAIVMWMYVLNRCLESLGEYEQDPILKQVTARAVNPGNLEDSRALRVNTPAMLTFLSMFIIRPFIFLLRRIMHPTMRAVAEAAVDIVGAATFTLSKKDESSPGILNEEKQQTLWRKCLEWANITKENTALQGGIVK